MTTLNNLTMSAVIEDSILDATVIRSLVSYHGGWKDFKAIASDISNYGANTGISFVYYPETNKAFRANAKALRSWLEEVNKHAYDCGLLEMLQSWNGISEIYSLDEIGSALYAGKGDAVDAVFSTIIYSAVEDLANTIVNLVD